MTIAPGTALRPLLEGCAEALPLALEPSQTDALLAYVGLLQRWNGVYNLTAIRDPQAMVVQHLVDSLAVVRPLQRHAAGRPLQLLDVGSGAGLPGVVLAIVLPSVEVTCVDTVGKKAAFVRQVAAELHLPNLHSRHGRVEAVDEPSFDIVISRAFSSLADFVRLSDTALADDGVWLAMKGKPPVEEMQQLPPTVEVFHVEHLTVPGLAAERCLVWMRRAGLLNAF